MTALPTLGGNNGQATGVNNRGQVAGGTETATPDLTCPPGFFFLEFAPVVWEKGEVQELPTIAGDPDGSALAINDIGQAVGYSGNCTTLSHALLWENGAAIDLGNFGGTAPARLTLSWRRPHIATPPAKARHPRIEPKSAEGRG